MESLSGDTGEGGKRRETEDLLWRAAQENPQALGEMFDIHRDRLRRMVRLRMDRRLQGRVDVSDVLQEAFLDATKSFPEYKRRPSGSFFLWLRCITGRRLMDLHRYHLGAQARDARREISINQGVPDATSEALAARLLGHDTSPSEAAVREEKRARIQEALDLLEDLDREVLALRHFEQLTNAEAAEVLGIQTSAASKRHVRALARLKDVLKRVGASSEGGG